MRKFTCGSCGTEIKGTLVALSWPSNIRCRKCKARHRFNYSAILGSTYILLVFLLMLGIKAFADQFEIQRGNVYSTSPVQAALQLGAPLLAIAMVGPLYVWVLGRFFEFRRQGP